MSQNQQNRSFYHRSPSKYQLARTSEHQCPKSLSKPRNPPKSKPGVNKCPQLQRQKGPTDAYLPNTLTLQNDRQTLTHELAIEQELPPLYSASLTSFDTTTCPATLYPTKFNPTHTTEKPTTESIEHTAEAWRSGKLTTKRLEQFASTVLPSSVQVQLAQPFGKDDINQSFYAEKCFRHILLPLLKSGYLSCRATKKLETASQRARQLQQLRKKYNPIDFRPLQGFQADWEATNEIRADWKEMTSACLLHYNGDVATMVRWIGGPHVNAHIDARKTLAKLEPILTPDVYHDLKRILTTGGPSLM